MNSLPLAICTLVLCVSGFGKSTQNTGSEVESGIHADTPLLLYFRSDDCTNCASVDQYFENDMIKARLEEYYVAVCIDIGETEGKACAEIYQVRSVPTVIIADRHGKVLFRTRPLHAEREIFRILEEIGVESEASEVPSPLKTAQFDPVDQPGKYASFAMLESRTTCSLTCDPSSLKQPQAEAVFHERKSSAEDPISPEITPETFPQIPVEVESGTPEEMPVSQPVVIDESTGTEVIKAQTKWQYAVQLGYFSSEPYAQKLVVKARQKGVTDIRAERGTRDGREFIRVLSGTYPSLREAQKHLNHITSLGLKAAIHRW